jgi:hypothetical protein
MSDSRWRKSSRSTSTESCVEVGHTLDVIRDSKNPAGPRLSVSAVDTFLHAVKQDRLSR